MGVSFCALAIIKILKHFVVKFFVAWLFIQKFLPQNVFTRNLFSTKISRCTVTLQSGLVQPGFPFQHQRWWSMHVVLKSRQNQVQSAFLNSPAFATCSHLQSPTLFSAAPCLISFVFGFKSLGRPTASNQIAVKVHPGVHSSRRVWQFQASDFVTSL